MTEELMKKPVISRTMSIEDWLATREEVGRQVDPETAEVDWFYAQTLDPYGLKELPEELQQTGREYFARAPGPDEVIPQANP
jgi:hypothetical protein